MIPNILRARYAQRYPENIQNYSIFKKYFPVLHGKKYF